MRPQIVNIVNFVRGCEPRQKIDLVKPVMEQLKLLKQYSLPGTFLLQYDAFIKEEFSSLFTGAGDSVELGLWLEMNQPLVERAGLVWRGRPGWAWDYHSDIGFSVGYRPEERKTLADECFRAFKAVFGRFPSTVGSWFIDAVTLGYLYDRYSIAASCNCKDQWGTDGYTIWGGYYGQAYYPSRSNMLCPAQTREQQISVPVFRMLGSDPIYQYDAGSSVDRLTECQPVVTLEPVYSGESGGGGNPDWVRWYVEENFNGICLSFGYTQAGQENSFGWEAMAAGLTQQFSLFASLRDAGRISVETMEKTGRWYQDTYPLTPPSAIAARTDWKSQGRQSCWFSSSRYRVNLYFEDGCFRIRDFTLFDERYPERYLDAFCDSPAAHFDNLPLMDGHRWSEDGVKAGIWLCNEGGDKAAVSEASFRDAGDGSLVTTFTVSGGSRCTVMCREDRIQIDLSEYPEGQLRFVMAHDGKGPALQHHGNIMLYHWNRFEYVLRVSTGTLAQADGILCVLPDCNGQIELIPDTNTEQPLP